MILTAFHRPAAAPARRTVRILVLNGNPVDAGIIADACTMMRDHDVRCRIVGDCREAADLVAAEPFDILFAAYRIGRSTCTGFAGRFAPGGSGRAVVLTGKVGDRAVRAVGRRVTCLQVLPEGAVTAARIRAAVAAALAGPVPAPDPARPVSRAGRHAPSRAAAAPR